jgi:hypothetical protein
VTDTDTQSKLAEYEDMVRLLTAKLEQLAAENARLRSSENSAHAVLREVCNDPTASPAVRVKAAIGALNVEKPRLTPVPPAIDATCKEIIPLNELLRRRRKRQDELENLPLDHPKRLEWVDRDESDLPPGNGSDNAR